MLNLKLMVRNIQLVTAADFAHPRKKVIQKRKTHEFITKSLNQPWRISQKPYIPPNKAIEPTPMAGTLPAGQEECQP
jgi:hypothetical protein